MKHRVLGDDCGCPSGKVGLSDSRMRPHPEALYFHIARKALDRIEEERDEFQLALRVATALVFSALTLEAFINQQFEQHPETKKLMADEKFSLTTKWLMLPLLLGGKTTFHKGKPPFQKFSKLTKLRDDLVHFKTPKKIDLTDHKSSKQFFSYLVKDFELARCYFNVVEEMIRKLHELTDYKTEVPAFLSGTEYLTTIWADASIEFGGEA